MLSGHAASFHQRSDSGELLEDLISESDEEELAFCGKVVYRASFTELKENNVKYDTIIWVLISLLLVMAWGIGLLMLLYLPFKRYVLRKEISSRTLYVTEDNIVYKVTEIFRLREWTYTLTQIFCNYVTFSLCLFTFSMLVLGMPAFVYAVLVACEDQEASASSSSD